MLLTPVQANVNMQAMCKLVKRHINYQSSLTYDGIENGNGRRKRKEKIHKDNPTPSHSTSFNIYHHCQTPAWHQHPQQQGARPVHIETNHHHGINLIPCQTTSLRTGTKKKRRQRMPRRPWKFDTSGTKQENFKKSPCTRKRDNQCTDGQHGLPDGVNSKCTCASFNTP